MASPIFKCVRFKFSNFCTSFKSTIYCPTDTIFFLMRLIFIAKYLFNSFFFHNRIIFISLFNDNIFYQIQFFFSNTSYQFLNHIIYLKSAGVS